MYDLMRPRVYARDFGLILRLLRHRADLTQEELASRTGLSVRAISNLERGVSAPRHATVAALLDGLELSAAASEELRHAARTKRLSAYGRLAGNGFNPG
jgi:transcriptional regulator with XRE-family HTH domain